MPKVSASQAAKMAGKSIPTITRAIKSNKLSAEKNESGGYLIEVSELERVYPLKAPVSDDTPKQLDHETPSNDKMLQREIDLLREMLEKTEADRDSWKEQAQRVTALIEDHSSKRSGFWSRLFKS